MKEPRDLYAAILTDTNFRDKVKSILGNIGRHNDLMKKGNFSSTKKRDQLMMELLQTCDWNLGILLPLFYPNMIEGSPLNMMRRPFGFMMTQMRVGGYTAIRGSRQIAKSTNLIARQMLKSFLFPRFQSMYICPHPHHKKTYADRFRQMEAECPYMDIVFKKGSTFRNNLYFKEYPLGGVTHLVNCLSDVSQARSKTTDELLYDEYQLFDMTLEEDIEPCQSVSKVPMTVYAGTSTTVDSPLEYRYQEGSQHTWKVKSPNGKDWIDFGDADEIIKCIKPEGLTCPYSSKPLDVASGHFTPTFKDRWMYGDVSIHVPQMIIADKISDPLEWEKIFKAFHGIDRNSFLEEYCGIPSEMGSREITEKDLRDICVLGSKASVFEKVKKGYYQLIVSGNDWGGSDHLAHIKKSRVSFTAHSMLGLAPDGKVDILHMRNYPGMNYDEITADIANRHKEHQGQAMAADAAGGQVYLNNFDRLLNHKTNFRFNYHAHVHKLVSMPHEGSANHFTLNKHESISQMFKAIKDGHIRCYDWEEAQPRLSEMLNIQRVLIDPQAGPSKFHYHMTPRNPDDTVQSINYAYVLLRLLRGDNVVDNVAAMRTIQESLRGQFSAYGPSVNDLGNLMSGSVISF